MRQDWEVLEFDFIGFEWDDEKAESNWRKHGIDFEEAKDIFKDPVLAQAQFEGGEDRWCVIGAANGHALIVVFAERDEFCRIISARRADRKSRARYYEVFGR